MSAAPSNYMQPRHPVLLEVTERIVVRSRQSRAAYLARLQADRAQLAGRPARTALGCSNLAHAAAACGGGDRPAMTGGEAVGIGVVTAYNDMLSAHAPYETYPQRIRTTAARHGAVARVAGGVPAMCDGITQGRPGMELSLFSRDVIAMSTAVALSHDVFDAALMLGVCDRSCRASRSARCSSVTCRRRSCRRGRWPPGCRTPRRRRCAGATPRAG